jgi:hypothetical protein
MPRPSAPVREWTAAKARTASLPGGGRSAKHGGRLACGLPLLPWVKRQMLLTVTGRKGGFLKGRITL